MPNTNEAKNKAITLFEGSQIRRHWDAEKELWYFSVIDIVGILAQNDRPRKYWDDLKRKLKQEGSEVSEKIGQLKMMAPDGKMRETDCADTEGMFRLIQSIPSPNAESFKLWLARVGYERLEDIRKSPFGLFPTTTLDWLSQPRHRPVTVQVTGFCISIISYPCYVIPCCDTGSTPARRSGG